jgi:hypothetical protein
MNHEIKTKRITTKIKEKPEVVKKKSDIEDMSLLEKYRGKGVKRAFTLYNYCTCLIPGKISDSGNTSHFCLHS